MSVYDNLMHHLTEIESILAKAKMETANLLLPEPAERSIQLPEPAVPPEALANDQRYLRLSQSVTDANAAIDNLTGRVAEAEVQITNVKGAIAALEKLMADTRLSLDYLRTAVPTKTDMFAITDGLGKRLEAVAAKVP